jgi:Asp-tRNA(Asn)/Glu-tRNA(Gln) amidotransferase A subunit family amidase
VTLKLVLTGLVCLLAFDGCTIGPRAATRDRAFIEYWPPAKPSEWKLAIKDNIDMKGVVTTAGSEFLAKHAPPAKRDAACLGIARERHVPIVGKTNLSEFAVAPSGINEYFGTPESPLSHGWKRIAGGSSCGSAVAVANREADVAFGTDTAGSIRVPAACCGVVGLKTTRGLVSLKGIYPIEPEILDTVGPLARDVAGTAEGMGLLESGFASRYAAAKAQMPSAQRIRVGRLMLKGTNPKIDAAVDAALAKTGFQVVRLSDRFRDQWDQAKKDGDTMAAVGIWLNYQKYGNDGDISGRTKSGILLGRLDYGDRYRQALSRQRAWQGDLEAVLEKVDFIALPTMQNIPPHMTLNFRVGVMDERVLGMQNTVPVNVAGNPALAVPIPLAHAGFPAASLQLIGRYRSEAALLNAGRLVEAAVKIK